MPTLPAIQTSRRQATVLARYHILTPRARSFLHLERRTGVQTRARAPAPTASGSGDAILQPATEKLNKVWADLS
eukprot:13722195-Alexandrium_andersonii.AAC.1